MALVWLSVALALAVLPLQRSLAQVVALDQSESLDDKRTGWLPYAFSTDSLGTAIGIGGFFAGRLQPQTSLFATAFVTSNESELFAASANNFRLLGSRFFFDAFLLVDHFTDQRFYAEVDHDPSQPRAGSNDSDPDDYVTGISDETTVNLTLKYPLAIGGIRDDPVAVYRLQHGLLQSGPVGGRAWNPLTSGRTTLAARYFYTYRDLRDFEEHEDTLEINPQGFTRNNEDQLEARTNGLEYWIEYDNTDFPRNPGCGSRQQLKLSHDSGWLDSSRSWIHLELDAAKYVNLGTSRWFRQQVLALNFWTATTPTWETDADNPQRVKHRPPPGYGSELGGIDRLRAYPSGRFHDKSAVYYAAELRFIPRFQKMRDWPVIRYFEFDWLQIVPFVEAGRVAGRYDAELFTEDLKVSAGLGLRAMAFRAVYRLDFAASDEGASVTAMVSQPFSRPGN